MSERLFNRSKNRIERVDGKSISGKGLSLYKEFIDGLVKQNEGVERRRIIGIRYPENDENKGFNDMLASLVSLTDFRTKRSLGQRGSGCKTRRHS